jgi:hypothetical protein
MSLRPCLGCGTPTDQARCLTCRQPELARRTAKRQAFGYHSENWQTTRLERLALDGWRCQLRLPGCTERATHVHLDPAKRGNHWTASVDDCVSCCASCSGAIDAPRARPRGEGIDSKTRDPASLPRVPQTLLRASQEA